MREREKYKMADFMYVIYFIHIFTSKVLYIMYTFFNVATAAAADINVSFMK
jgi:hypothetical protein